jgi:hypothetical protein
VTGDRHAHDFGGLPWPFAEAEHTAAFTTVPVMHGRPVLVVSHDEEGDWQFLCDATLRAEDCKIVCLGCALQRDHSLAEVADLPTGWQAIRAHVGGPWQRLPPE